MLSHAVAVLVVASGLVGVDGPWVGSDATRTRIVTANLDGSDPRVVLDSPHRLAAPEWTPDGSSLVVDGGGQLWRVPASGGEPVPVATGIDSFIGINHAISPDGKSLAFTSGPIWKVDAAGGRAAPIKEEWGNWLHGWSPDGKWLAYSSKRGSSLDLYAGPVGGGEERRLTTHRRLEDAPQFSGDGRWVYFLADWAGGFDLWRVPAEGGGPDDSKAERVTSDEFEDASPRPSPDGKWLVFLSYPPRTPLNAEDRDVRIRRVPLGEARPDPAAKPEEIARLVGGHGTLGARAFSPDGKRFVYASFEPPAPTVRIAFVTPSDRKPPANVKARLTQVAEAAEAFLLGEMRRRGYPPAVDRIFRREDDGSVEVLFVPIDRPASALRTDFEVADGAIARATWDRQIAGTGHFWWVFAYAGDPPARIDGWMGSGYPAWGGRCCVNYDSQPGEIRPGSDLTEGLHAEDKFALKGTVHELGHALGLPHEGPDLTLKLGNSLMGPNTSAYIARKHPHDDPVYLTAASAAMLWKHPAFSETARDRRRQPTLKLLDYEAAYSRTSDRITLSGRLVADIPAHSVVVLDDRGRPTDEYWNVGHVGRVGHDGRFRVLVDRPARADGHFRILFCFDNGIVTGDGAGVSFDDRGAIRKGYRFRDGVYSFGD